jgi:hypothetical protein
MVQADEVLPAPQATAKLLQECYDTVPNEFFSSDFHLYENNPTIDSFIENAFGLLRRNADRGEEHLTEPAITALRVKTEQALSEDLNKVRRSFCLGFVCDGTSGTNFCPERQRYTERETTRKRDCLRQF